MQTPIMADVGLRRLDMLLQNQVEIVDAPDAIELSVFRFVIRFENVSFSYTGKSYQLDQMNLFRSEGKITSPFG